MSAEPAAPAGQASGAASPPAASSPTAVATLVVAAIAVGAVNAVIFVGFEWLVTNGTDWAWDTVAGSDASRWRVLPLAAAGSVLLSAAVRAAGQERVVRVRTDPTDAHEEQSRTTVSTVVVTLAVGAVSLIGGASLGPEAPLAAASKALGELFAPSKALILASVGALLVAFFGSPVAILIPLLLLHRRHQLTVGSGLIAIAAGLTAFAVLRLLKDGGYGDVPVGTHFDAGDLLVALLVGAVGVLVASWLKLATTRFARRTRRLDDRLHWALSAAVFGAGLGVLYLVGGESVQFSGSDGSSLLVHEHAHDATLILLGLAGVKLLATGWCLACGYRGGPVFPSVYVGVAISLALGSLAGPGATIGAITGILTALTSPVLAAVMALSLLPVKLCGVALAGTAGAFAAGHLFSPPGDEAD